MLKQRVLSAAAEQHLPAEVLACIEVRLVEDAQQLQRGRLREVRLLVDEAKHLAGAAELAVGVVGELVRGIKKPKARRRDQTQPDDGVLAAVEQHRGLGRAPARARVDRRAQHLRLTKGDGDEVPPLERRPERNALDNPLELRLGGECVRASLVVDELLHHTINVILIRVLAVQDSAENLLQPILGEFVAAGEQVPEHLADLARIDLHVQRRHA